MYLISLSFKGKSALQPRAIFLLTSLNSCGFIIEAVQMLLTSLIDQAIKTDRMQRVTAIMI